MQCCTNCFSCDSAHEDPVHVVFDYPLATQVWQMVGMWNDIHKDVLTTTSTSEAVFLLLQHGNLKPWHDVNELCAQVVECAHHLIRGMDAGKCSTTAALDINLTTFLHGSHKA